MGISQPLARLLRTQLHSEAEISPLVVTRGDMCPMLCPEM